MNLDASAPDRAVTRTDLTFLRHRARPVAKSHSAIAEFVAGRASAHAGTADTQGRRASAPAQAPASPDPVRQRVTEPTPATVAARADAAASASSSLDLFAPQQVSVQPGPARQVPTQSTSTAAGANLLDLSEPASVHPPTDIDLSRPATARVASGGPTPASEGSSTSLDLGVAPLTPQVTTSSQPARRPPGGSTSLDLGAAPMTRPAAPGRSTSLDLSPAGPTPAAPTRPAPARPVPRGGATTAAPAGSPPTHKSWVEHRTTPGVPTILTPRSPTVTLTRVQSGVGTLTFEAVAAPGIGDLRLGCAYHLRSGRSSTVQHQAGRRYAPPGETRRPMLLAGRQQFERLEIDLRQITDLERYAVYAFSGDGGELHWGGTLVVITYGGDRIEMPIEMAPSNAVAVLATGYNIRGQLVLRSEMDLIGRTIREACRGYGYDRITWLDDQTPID